MTPAWFFMCYSSRLYPTLRRTLIMGLGVNKCSVRHILFNTKQTRMRCISFKVTSSTLIVTLMLWILVQSESHPLDIPVPKTTWASPLEKLMVIWNEDLNNACPWLKLNRQLSLFIPVSLYCPGMTWVLQLLGRKCWIYGRGMIPSCCLLILPPFHSHCSLTWPLLCRCLVEKGDVAFVKHSAVPQNTNSMYLHFLCYLRKLWVSRVESLLTGTFY